MRVLWVSNETPDRCGQGGQRRQFFLVEGLARIGHRVEVCTLAGPQRHDEIARIAKVTRVNPSVAGRIPHPLFRRQVQSALAPADVLVVSHTESWRTFARALAGPRPRTAVDVHNVYGHRTAGDAADGSGQGPVDPAKPWAAVEDDIATRADLVIVGSEVEVSRFGRTDRIPVHCVPHGVDPREWPTDPSPAPEPSIRLFGSWGWRPNALGLRWFVTQVWPEVYAATGATAHVAGTGAEAIVAGRPGVLDRGRVENLPGFLASAWIVGVPVRDGIGAPVKYGEALATGIPVLATVDGAPQANPGTTVSDNPGVWVDTLGRVLGDAAPPPMLRGAARADLLNRLSWSARAAELADLLGG